MKYAIIGLAAFASLLGFSASALAQSGSTSYTYVEGSYEGSTFNTDQALGDDADGNGGRFEASLALHKNMYVFGTYQISSLDDITNPAPVVLDDATLGTIGFGFNTGLSSGRIARDYRGLLDRYSLFLNGQWKHLDIDNVGDADGFEFEVGLRSINFTPFEFIASVGYEEFDSAGGNLTLEGRLLYEVLTNLQLQFGVDWNDDRSSLFFGVRYNFPKLVLF